MTRIEQIGHELRQDGPLDQAIWELTRWLTNKQISYNLPDDASEDIISDWETRGINKEDTIKYREWKHLSNYENELKAELSELIRKKNNVQQESETAQSSEV